MNIYKINDIAELIAGNSYVGRGIVLGKSKNAKYACSAYFIMGRSNNSRNRIFTEKDGSVYTEPYDASKVEDPSLIIYAAIRSYENKLIVTNGNQTDTIYDGLCEGLSYVMKRGERDIFEKESKIIAKIRNAFFRDRRIFTYSEGEGAIWLFNIRGVPSQTAAALLDEKGICVRPGLHCAPLAHKSLRTPEDGAVRVSAGPLTEAWQADHFIRALSGILRTLPD